MGELYMVATPIGNLGDITLRALETLKSVDLIACEDTRRTLQLLNRFSIAKKLISCRAQNEAAAAQTVCRALEAGQSVAYCSDAGTPERGWRRSSAKTVSALCRFREHRQLLR